MAEKKKVEYLPKAKITFSREYEFNGQMKDHLQMREPTIADEMNAQEMAKSDNELQLLLFANLCDISLDELRQIASKDGAKIAEVYQNFLS